MKQQLLPKSMAEKIPALYEQDGKGMQATAYAKFFHPYGAGTWYVTEFDGEDICFGWAEIHPGCGELGYFSLKEMEAVEARINGQNIPGLQAIERDIHFKPTPLCDIPEVKRSLEARGC